MLCGLKTSILAPVLVSATAVPNPARLHGSLVSGKRSGSREVRATSGAPAPLVGVLPDSSDSLDAGLRVPRCPPGGLVQLGSI